MTSTPGGTQRAVTRPQDRTSESYRLQPRRALTDDVYEAVKALVMDQVVAAGDRMSIDGLARDLGVSPTPVREVLCRSCRNLVQHYTAAGDHDRARLFASFVDEFDSAYERHAQP